MTVLLWRVALWLAMPGAVVTWLVTGFPEFSSGKGAVRIACRFDDDFISVEVLGSVAIARFSRHAAAYGHSAWIVSCLPARLFVMDPW
jgi:hypothetical protein